MCLQMALLAVDGNKESGLEQSVDDLQFLLAGVAGDVQALELVIGMAVYLPFMRISEKAIAKQEALAEQNA